LHSIRPLAELSREEVCENGCTAPARRLEAISLHWRAEMKEALYQFERREARRRRKLAVA
jgi:hypothetical protein